MNEKEIAELNDYVLKLSELGRSFLLLELTGWFKNPTNRGIKDPRIEFWEAIATLTKERRGK